MLMPQCSCGICHLNLVEKVTPQLLVCSHFLKNGVVYTAQSLSEWLLCLLHNIFSRKTVDGIDFFISLQYNCCKCNRLDVSNVKPFLVFWS